MKRIFLLLLLLPGMAAGQVLPTPFYLLSQIDSNSAFGLGTTYAAQSNSLNNRFFLDIGLTTYLENDIKESLLPKLKDPVRVGYGRQDYWYLRLQGKDTSHAWGVYGANRTFYAGKMSPDAVELALFGNSRFAGETAEMPDVRLTRYDYQSLNVSRMQTINEKWRYGWTAGLVRGWKYVNLDISDASLYTSTWGDSLHFMGSIDYSASNLRMEWYRTGGWGLNAGGYVERRMGGHRLMLMVEDIGFISWRKSQSTRTSFDTSGAYEGINFLKDSIAQPDANPQDLINNVIDRFGDSVGFTTTLPTQFRLGWQHDKWFASASFVAFAQHLPRISAGARWPVGAQERLLVTTALHLSGYAPYGVELGGQLKIGNIEKPLVLLLGTHHLEGFFLKDKTTAQGLYVQLSKWW